MDPSLEPEETALERLARNLRGKAAPAAHCAICEEPYAVAPVPNLPESWSFGGLPKYTFGECRECGEICGLNVQIISLEGELSSTAYGFPRPLISVATSPMQRLTLNSDDIVVPPYMPPRVTALFQQARHNLVLQNWDAAGMTYRKTLEVALGEKFGFPGKMRLSTMTKRLSRSEPSAFQLFAWLAREGGNSGAHDTEFEEAGAQLLDSHTEQLTVYLFTVPEIKNQLVEARHKRC